MRAILTAVALACLAGCGGDIQRGKLHGTIKYQGKPVAIGTLIFVASDNLTYTAELDKDGSYSVDRVPFGALKVALTQPPARVAPKADPTSPKGKTAQEGKDANRPPAPAAEPKATWMVVPTSYNRAETSGLSLEMKATDQDWSVDLK